jgi:hypothetical protein
VSGSNLVPTQRHLQGRMAAPGHYAFSRLRGVTWFCVSVGQGGSTLRISCSATELPRRFADLRAARSRVYHHVLIHVLKGSGSLPARPTPRAGDRGRSDPPSLGGEQLWRSIALRT